MKTKKIILAIGIVAVSVVLGILTFVPVQVYPLPYSEYGKMVSSTPRFVSIEIDTFKVSTSDSSYITLQPCIKYIILDLEGFYQKNRKLIDERFIYKMETEKDVVCDSIAEGLEFKRFSYDIGDFFEFRSKTIDPFLYEVFLDFSFIEVAEEYLTPPIKDAYRHVLNEYSSDSLSDREVYNEINTKIKNLVNEKIKNECIEIHSIMSQIP